MGQLLISEDDLLNVEERVGEQIKEVFGVKRLDEYSSEELIHLLLAISDGYERSKKVGLPHIVKSLEIWGARVRQAAASATYRERYGDL